MDSRNFTGNAQFLRETSETFLGMSLGPRGMLWAIMAHFGPPGTPRKSALFQKRGRKRMKELGEVTFMKEGMKALSVGFVLPLTHLQNLVSFPRYGRLKKKKSAGINNSVYSK